MFKFKHYTASSVASGKLSSTLGDPLENIIKLWGLSNIAPSLALKLPTL